MVWTHLHDIEHRVGQQIFQESASKGHGAIQGWENFWVGKISAAPNFGALCTVAGVRYTAGTRKNLLGYSLGQKMILWDTPHIQEKNFGIRTRIKTDPDMQDTGTSTSLEKKNVSCRPREQDMARIAQKHSRRELQHQSEKRSSPRNFAVQCSAVQCSAVQCSVV